MQVVKPNFGKRGGAVVGVVQDAKTGLIHYVKPVTESSWGSMLATAQSYDERTNSHQKIVAMRLDCDGDALLCRVTGGYGTPWQVGKQPDFILNGLVTVVAQNADTKEVLMVAYTDHAGWRRTMETGFGNYWSTSRNKSWKKGEESGNFQQMVDMGTSPDGQTLLYSVRMLGEGYSCHLNTRSCFFCDFDGTLLEKPQKEFKALAMVPMTVHENLQVGR